MSWLQTHEVSVPFYEDHAGKQVFAIQLRERALRQEELARNWSSITSTSSQLLVDGGNENDSSFDNDTSCLAQNSRAFHVTTTMRSYSQFRKLWRNLIRATKMPSTTAMIRASSSEPRGSAPDRRVLSRSLSNTFQSLSVPGVNGDSPSSCRCRNWNCTFRSCHDFLKNYPFPSKLVMKRSTPAALENRRQGLELFITTVRGLFDTFPRPLLQDVDDMKNCQVLIALDAFFGFNEKQLSNSATPTTLQHLSARKRGTNASDIYRFSSTASLDSGSSGRTPSSSYSACTTDTDRGSKVYETGASLYLQQDPETDFELQKLFIPDLSGLQSKQNDDQVYMPSRLSIKSCSHVMEKMQSRSESYRSSNIRRQTALLAQNPTMTTARDHTPASGTKAPQTLLPGLPKPQIPSSETTTIRTFLEEFRDHLLLDSEALGSSASSLEKWNEDRQWELALYVASQIGHAHAVSSILYRGTDPNAVMEDGLSSLHVACRGGHRSIVAMLLTYGADPNVMDGNGVAPLLPAVQLGDLEIVDMLVEYGANVNLCTTDNVSAVHVAVACEALSVLQLLLEYDAFVNTPNLFNGKTPLHLAAQCGSLVMCKLLLQYGGNIFHRTTRGLNVAEVAKSHGHQNVAKFCISFTNKREGWLPTSVGSSNGAQTAAGAPTFECSQTYCGSLSPESSHEVTIVSEDGYAYAVM